MKELIAIQMTVAFAMIAFSQALRFTPEAVLLIVGVSQILNTYVIGFFWNRSVKKPKYNISMKDGTVG